MSDLEDRYVEVQPEHQEDLSRHVQNAMAERGLRTQQALAEASGIAVPTVAMIYHGKPGKRFHSTLRSISVALGWTPDSIARILAGLEPMAIAGTVSPEETEGLAELREEVAALHSKIEELTALVLRLPGIHPDELPRSGTNQ